tara:strand:- start:163 stop:396 length:234 start_codon:yes stop_codon:yes gene_type:complete
MSADHKLIRTEIVQDSIGERHAINKWRGRWGGFFFTVIFRIDEQAEHDEDFDKSEISLPLFKNRKRAMQEIYWSTEG